MQERMQMGLAGRADARAGRSPEEWAGVAVGDVRRVAEAVARRAFLYEDPRSFADGVRELAVALRTAGLLPGNASA